MAKTNFQIFNEENAPERTYNDSEYKEATQRLGGVMPGMALSRMHNKMYYQWSAMCKAIANLIVNHGHDCMDSDVAGITRYLDETITNAADTEVKKHRTKTPLDHPDGSVLKRHLGFEVYDKGEVYSKNEINQSYRKIGNRIVSGDVDWNTLTEATTYKIQGVVMDAAHHAPPNEYNFGLLVVNRLENGADSEWHTVQIYFPHSIRGYWSRMYNGPADYRAEGWLEWRYIPTHNEVETIAEQKASTKVSKLGDTIDGKIVFAHNPSSPESSKTICSIFPAHYYHNYWRENDRTVYIHSYPKSDPPEGGTRFAFRVATENKRWHEYTFDKDGLSLNGKNLAVYSIYADDWVRIQGENNGIHWQKYGGGWHMTDKEWIRAWSGKGIYTSGKIRCDAGFEGTLRGTADNANTVGGKSLQWILEQINAAKTGIVAGNLEQNGWVKFANGLIVQWGVWRNLKIDQVDKLVKFHMPFPGSCFIALLTLQAETFVSGANNVYVKKGSLTRTGLTIVPDYSTEIIFSDVFYVALGR